MHSSLVLLFIFSVVLIVLMITCFVCFIRSRKKEEKEFLEQVQYTTRQQQQHQHQHQLQQQQQLQANHSPKMNASPSDEFLINDNSSRQLIYQRDSSQVTNQQQQQQQQQQAPPMVGYPSTDTSPYRQHKQAAHHQHHPAPSGQVSPRAPTETRSDITQQINSAIIGSSEAEFQNDFIQVFPMYQIAPMPEKNTTPYLT